MRHPENKEDEYFIVDGTSGTTVNFIGEERMVVNERGNAFVHRRCKKRPVFKLEGFPDYLLVLKGTYGIDPKNRAGEAILKINGDYSWGVIRK